MVISDIRPQCETVTLHSSICCLIFVFLQVSRLKNRLYETDLKECRLTSQIGDLQNTLKMLGTVEEKIAAWQKEREGRDGKVADLRADLDAAKGENVRCVSVCVVDNIDRKMRHNDNSGHSNNCK